MNPFGDIDPRNICNYEFDNIKDIGYNLDVFMERVDLDAE